MSRPVIFFWAVVFWGTVLWVFLHILPLEGYYFKNIGSTWWFPFVIAALLLILVRGPHWIIEFLIEKIFGRWPR